MSWIRGDVALLVEILLLIVEFDQSLVQRLIEQLEILRASPDIAVFPEPILSSAMWSTVFLTLLLRNVFRVLCMKTQFGT